eukprot:COSAG01_NODE_674_length_14337_cov_14.996418_6_plen_163_part_00
MARTRARRFHHLKLQVFDGCVVVVSLAAVQVVGASVDGDPAQGFARIFDQTIGTGWLLKLDVEAPAIPTRTVARVRVGAVPDVFNAGRRLVRAGCCGARGGGDDYGPCDHAGDDDRVLITLVQVDRHPLVRQPIDTPTLADATCRRVERRRRRRGGGGGGGL